MDKSKSPKDERCDGRSLYRQVFAALGALALGGCSAFENLGGGKKLSPDEFKIVSHSPLTMPPNAELRPPRPGEPRPQEVTPADQAKEALSPALAGAAAAQPGHDRRGPGPRPHQRRGVAGAEGGRRQRRPQHPQPGQHRHQDHHDSDKTFIDSLIFWQDTPPPAWSSIPTKEQQRMRDAQAAGPAAPAGQTPTIKRRQRGLLEGIF